MKNRRVLIVDDETVVRYTLKRLLSPLGYEVKDVEDAEEALGAIHKFDPALVITDIRLPGISGLELLERVVASRPDIGVIIMTGFDDMDVAVESMKMGGVDYLVKPLDMDKFQGVVEGYFKDRRAALRRKGVKTEEEEGTGAEDGDLEEDLRKGRRIIGRDPKMIEIYKLVGKLARTPVAVLIRGETGTGKELVAREVHLHSAGKDNSFVPVNCAAIPPTLLESHLFGHVKGSFTGATTDRKGYFEMARGGTLFLDEIGETTLEFQAKLLRVLQEGEFYPVGGEKMMKVNARVIAGTNAPLEEAVRKGDFREDLYFRLRVVEVVMPPLRDRRQDIPLIANHLLERLKGDLNREVREIDKAVMERLMAYDWPGNVRELENTLSRALVFSTGSVIKAEHVSLGVGAALRGGGVKGGDGSGGYKSLEEVEAEHVQRVLIDVGGNKTKASEILEISRPRIRRIIEKYELQVPGEIED